MLDDSVGAFLSVGVFLAMAFSLSLARQLAQRGWKVKIRDKERCEMPHVTIFFKRATWRLSLRDGTFLDEGDQWSQIDSRVKDAITTETAWQTLRHAWDRMYPENPIG